MTPALGPRAAARANVRNALVAAAYQLCGDDGFEAVTTQEVADLAGVSQRTFFRYFPAKEDVLLDFFDDQNRRICEAIRRRPAGEPAERLLRHGFQTYVEMDQAEIERTRMVIGLANGSSQLRKALTLRQAVWEERIAETLLERDEIAEQDELRTRHLVAMAMAILSVAFRMTLAPEEHDFEMSIDAGFALFGVETSRPI